MPKGVLAYRSGAVMERLKAGDVPEPYSTALYIHGRLGASRISRDDLLNLELSDVQVDADAVAIQRPDGRWVPLTKMAMYALRNYLRDWRSKMESPWLFPLPMDVRRPANADVAKRYLSRIIHHARSEQ